MDKREFEELAAYAKVIGTEESVGGLREFEGKLREAKDETESRLLSAVAQNIEFFRGYMAAIKDMLEMNDAARVAYKNAIERGSERSGG